MNISKKKAIIELAAFFNSNGYVRLQNATRYAEEGYDVYKKGDEVRIIASSQDELDRIQSLLDQLGFKPGKPFAKARKCTQPVYGKDAVARFLQLVAPTRFPLAAGRKSKRKKRSIPPDFRRPPKKAKRT